MLVTLGYSVFGWNHPGFGGSTGLPFPSQEINAIDVVMKFAVEKLNFELKNIIVMGWSIGGFSASCAAQRYPSIKGLILDASFDDLLPLALFRMPTSWKPLIINVIKNYFNLTVSKQLARYNGSVLIIRRTRDEIIFTDKYETIKSNRANNLLITLFQNRFPNLMSDQECYAAFLDWLSNNPLHQGKLEIH